MRLSEDESKKKRLWEFLVQKFTQHIHIVLLYAFWHDQFAKTVD